VSLIVNLVANGMGIDEIIEAYPYLEADDIRQALQYAAWLAEETVHARRWSRPTNREPHCCRSWFRVVAVIVGCIVSPVGGSAPPVMLMA